MTDHQVNTETISFATFGTIMSLLTVASLVGNIVCYRMTNRLRRNKPSLALVLNLNVSDTLVALVSWCSFMTQHIANHANSTISVIVHKAFWSLLVTLGNVTLLTLSGLAADCFIALRWPLHYRDITTIKAVRIYLAVSWIVSTLAGGSDFIAAIFKSESFTDAVHDSMVFSKSNKSVGEKLTASLTVLTSNILSLACLTALILLYGYILSKIHRIKKDNVLSKRGGFRSEVHAVRTTLMVFFSFLLLWLPTLVINIVSVLEPYFLSKLSLIEASFIGYSADTLLMVHSIVDAVIYGVRIKNTISRQRKSRLTLIDYTRSLRMGGSFSSSISSVSTSPKKKVIKMLSNNSIK